MMLHHIPRSIDTPHSHEPRAARLAADVKHCAVPRDYIAQPDANRRVRELIADELSAQGLAVTRVGALDNLVALPRKARGPISLVGAHYDSVPMTPGADDNASAVAVLLEVARMRDDLDGAVGFVAFNAEERGLLGSQEVAKSWRDDGRPAIREVHVLEMVGYASSAPDSQRMPVPIPGAPTVGDFIGLVANQRSRHALRRVLTAAKACDEAPPVVALQAWLGAERLVPDLYRSDHAPFWRAGTPALMWTDTAEFRNPNYHRPSDTPDTLDYDFMAGVAALLGRVLASPTLSS
jgi:Zn-dependent M28 family amino/carboxypeptidase